MSRTFFGGIAFPFFDTQIGPGSLGTFLGSEPGFAPDTVWYHPLGLAPEQWPALSFDASSVWFRRHMAVIEAGLKVANGRFLVGIPDLIENIDTLAQLRDSQTLMMDLFERPDWVKSKVFEINRAFFAAFDAMAARVRDEDGGNAFAAFGIWGPGKTAKLQCDASAMFSPAMFQEFVVPALTEQAEWLDYSLYHLDGTQCICHLDHLLAIDALDAIEWTPQAGIEGGGHPRWYDLYRRIKAGGKCVQAIGVQYDEVLPLIEAVGPEGLYVMATAPTEQAARKLLDAAS
jgi:5-methyltetrahydrofolate--homocysteine methyltransferase